MTPRPPSFIRWSLLALALAAAAGVVWLLPSIDRTLLMRGYLAAYLFLLGLALGSSALRALHNLTGGPWGDALRPAWNAASLSLPILLLLFIPLALTTSSLFPWAHGDPTNNDLWSHRAPYLNLTFFLARAGGYFILWIAADWATRLLPRHRGINSASLILYLFTMTHASFDWIMSREAHLYSTAFGLSVILGQVLSAMAFAILLSPLPATSTIPPTDRSRTKNLFNDIGNILLTLVILWMYVAFMQFLVIWMGNTQEDNAWYIKRGLPDHPTQTLAGWRIVGLLILLLHFLIPFFLLLFRGAKQYRPALSVIAGMLLGAHLIETFWLIAPSDEGRVPTAPQVSDILLFIALPALWFFAFLTFSLKPPKSPPPVEASHD